MLRLPILAAVLAAATALTASRLPRAWRSKTSKTTHAAAKTSGSDQWHTQRITHFDATSQNTWQQRYFINTTLYKPNGPVFLMIGGEGEANPAWLATPETSIMRYAKQHGAAVFLLEHRFYGASHPFNDTSVESLKFLSSEEALGDLAHFVEAMNQEMGYTHNPWYCFGGSYPGALSAWFRLKYPHLVAGAIATSAPVQPKADFQEYFEVVGDSLTARTGTRDCFDKVQAAHTEVVSQMKSKTGRQTLDKRFNTCAPLGTNANDNMNFVGALADNFAGVVQYNRDNRAFEGATDMQNTVTAVCSIMTDDNRADPYAEVNALIMKTYDEACLDYSYSGMIDWMKETSWDAGANQGSRQWVYQTCTEFGYYQSSTGTAIRNPFAAGDAFPLNFSVQQCADVYGAEFNSTRLTQGIEWTQTNYGGLVVGASNIVFVNGGIDPWHALSILEDVSEKRSVTSIFIPSTAHCANMYPPDATDPEALTAARDLIGAQLGIWIEEWE